MDKLDIEKSWTTPVNLSRLSNAVRNDVAKKSEYKAKIKKYGT